MRGTRRFGGGYESFVWLRQLFFVVHPAGPTKPWQQQVARACAPSVGAYELCRGIHSYNPPPA